MSEGGIKVIATNRKARFNYEVEESFEAGIELQGSEVKSFRLGKISFPDAFAVIEGGQAWLRQLHVPEYAWSSVFNHEPDRVRRLLLHALEIRRLERKVNEKGYTLVPLSFYFKNGRVKVEIGLCKGKKLHDKRATLRDRDMDRDMHREMNRRNR